MKAVIFDMDGVIIDSEPLHYEVETKMFEELGLSLEEGEHESFLGTNSKEMFRRLKSKHRIEKDVDQLVLEERRRYLEALSSGPLPLMPGLSDLVKTLDLAGMEIALASSSPHEQINLVMERSGLGRYFKALVSGDDVPQSKPDPAIYRKAAKQLSVNPTECWVIEDSDNGLRAAALAGMRCIALDNPSSGKQHLNDADRVIVHLNEARNIILNETML